MRQIKIHILFKDVFHIYFERLKDVFKAAFQDIFYVHFDCLKDILKLLLKDIFYTF